MSGLNAIRSAVADYFPMLFPKPAPRFVTESGNRVYGIVAEFSETPKVYHAAEMVRDAGYTRWDVHAPFPVHGMEQAMGVRSTRLPLIAVGAAITGVAFAAFLQWITTDYLYPTIVQGKPTGAWEPFMPVMFELGVLFTAFSCLFGMLALNGLPRFYHALFRSENFKRATDDGFFISIEARDPKFAVESAKSLLESAGGKNIEVLED